MKRVQISSDGSTVSNVSVLTASPAQGAGTYFDVADSVAVAPNYVWNGNSSSPSFAFAAPSPIMTADSRLALLETSMPTAASSAPPAVADAGSKGSQSLVYAVGDHTHASKARKQIAVSTAATLAWTYPSPFAAGVVPIVNGIAQVTNGNTDLFNVQIMGVPSNSGCLFQISRVSAGLFGLLTGALGINPTPATINVHMLALEP